MKEELMITTERIDDCVLLLGVMQLHLFAASRPARTKLGLDSEYLVISHEDHRKLPVRDWVRQAHDTLDD